VYAAVIVLLAVVGTLAGAVIICALRLVPWARFGSLFSSAVALLRYSLDQSQGRLAPLARNSRSRAAIWP